MRIPVLILALLGGVSCAVQPQPPPPADMLRRIAALYPHPCNAAAARVIADAGVPPDQVESVSYQPVWGGGRQEMIVGYIAWTRLRGRTGFLVANMDDDCRVQVVYTRGGLAIDGVRSHSY
ncbi:hypothetical protein [Arenibaculum pallidiluteum]|uniref:hypothetical protein n=1 Tax=Arenibaculum pallidiluteum TaxID=2812559 RepID=UPI001A96A988|nr:hypothetical protein [Arenibaculum pallidiluteum]